MVKYTAYEPLLNNLFFCANNQTIFQSNRLLIVWCFESNVRSFKDAVWSEQKPKGLFSHRKIICCRGALWNFSLYWCCNRMLIRLMTDVSYSAGRPKEKRKNAPVCPRGVMVKAMNCGIVVREFVLQSRYYVHFRANTLGKGMNPLILPPTMGK